MLNNFFSNIVKNLKLEYENLNLDLKNVKDPVFKAKHPSITTMKEK